MSQTRRPLIVFLQLVAATIALGGAAALGEETGRMLIEISMKPGKPRALRESITLSKVHDKFEMLVQRIPSKGEAKKERIEITKKQFESVSNIVVKNKLLNWMPPSKRPSGADHGEARVRFEWQPHYLSKPNIHDVGWLGRLPPDEKAITLLRETIAKMAIERTKSVKLYYFRVAQNNK